MNAVECIALHQAIGIGAETQELFSARGSHKGCGECCSRVLPLTPNEVELLRMAVEERGIELRPEEAEYDFTCPLLGQDRTCMVYDVRPIVCRDFDCSKLRSVGRKPHPFTSKLRLVDLRSELEK